MKGTKRPFSHSELVRIAERWLLNRGCAFAISELVTVATETPDAIGFRDGFSILVECKVSRSDFLADRSKFFRISPSHGMGAFRFYLCPAGVITVEDLPEKWGLLWADERGKVRMILGPKGNAWSYTGDAFRFQERNIQAEWDLMVSALRRVHKNGDLKKIKGNCGSKNKAQKRVESGCVPADYKSNQE